MSHQNVTDEILELASTYALGLLETSATGEFERHLSGCAVCWSEVKAFQEVAGELAYTAPEVRPSPRVRQELLARVAPPHVLVRADEGAWQSPFPGVEIRQLFVDKVTGAVTSMLRAAAGAVYPAHRHGG